MKEALGGILVGLVIVALVTPYFSLLNLRDLGGIKDELREIKEILKKGR